MPTEEATRVKCPECGATVRAAEGAAVAKCEYCGTESRVQRRSQFLQIPIRLPVMETSDDRPERVAIEVRTRHWPLAMIVIGGMLVPIVIPLVIWLAQKHGVGDNMMWNSPSPSLGDVDGDGYDDVIGYGRYVQRDLMRLNALSGKDGHTIWETDSLGTYTERYQDKVVLVNGLVLRADTEKRALIEAYDAKTGVKKWSQPTAEVIDRLCTVPNGVAILTKDKRAWTFEPNSGALSPTVLDGDDCDDIGTASRWRREPRRNELRNRIKVDGMQIEKVLGDHAPFIAAGTKEPGSRIPMLAGIDGSDHVAWKVEVPGSKPLEVKQSRPEFIAYDAKDVAVIYEKADNNQRPVVVEFDRATGQRRFEVEGKYTGDMFITVEGISLGNKMVFAMIEDSVQAYDRATGKLVWTAGKLD